MVLEFEFATRKTHCEETKAIFDASKTMARQAIAFRGHTEVDSNFYQIIRLISRNGSGSLNSWIEKKYDCTSLGLRMEY